MARRPRDKPPVRNPSEPAPPPLSDHDRALLKQAQAALFDAGRRLSTYVSHQDGLVTIKAVLDRIGARLDPAQAAVQARALYPDSPRGPEETGRPRRRQGRRLRKEVPEVLPGQLGLPVVGVASAPGEGDEEG